MQRYWLLMWEAESAIRRYVQHGCIAARVAELCALRKLGKGERRKAAGNFSRFDMHYVGLDVVVVVVVSFRSGGGERTWAGTRHITHDTTHHVTPATYFTFVCAD